MATAKTKTTARKRSNSKPAPAAKPAGFDWPKDPKAVLLDYLKSEVTDAQDAPNNARPFINEKASFTCTRRTGARG